MNISTNQIEEVRDLLHASVVEVFGTMLVTEVALVASTNAQASGERRVTGSAGFMGQVNGVIYLHMTAAFARVLASRLLGMDEKEFENDEMIDDSIGEVSNMVVGAVKSRLCADGFPCVLTMPRIIRGPSFSIGASGYSERRSLGFQCGDEQVVVELRMKPVAERT